MIVPKPKQLPSGTWFIRMRLGGGSQYITAPTERECTRRAELVKAEHRNGLRERREAQDDPTLSQAIEMYCEDLRASLSPETVRKYTNIQRNHWQELSDRRLSKITGRQWQQAATRMLEQYAHKTVSVSVGMTKTVVTYFHQPFPKIRLGTDFKTAVREKAEFLQPEEITAFVAEAAKTPYCIPLLLALHGLRIAEIDGLFWENVGPSSVKISQVRIKDKDNNMLYKQGAKNLSSVREVPVLIPELQAALDRDRKQSGKVMLCVQESLRRACARVCRAAGVPVVTPHHLRHSFASLTAYLGIPEQISQTLGGWANDKIMKQIYTHVSKSSMDESIKKLKDFYTQN